MEVSRHRGRLPTLKVLSEYPDDLRVQLDGRLSGLRVLVIKGEQRTDLVPPCCSVADREQRLRN